MSWSIYILCVLRTLVIVLGSKGGINQGMKFILNEDIIIWKKTADDDDEDEGEDEDDDDDEDEGEDED